MAAPCIRFNPKVTFNIILNHGRLEELLLQLLCLKHINIRKQEISCVWYIRGWVHFLCIKDPKWVGVMYRGGGGRLHRPARLNDRARTLVL